MKIEPWGYGSKDNNLGSSTGLFESSPLGFFSLRCTMDTKEVINIKDFFNSLGKE